MRCTAYLRKSTQSFLPTWKSDKFRQTPYHVAECIPRLDSGADILSEHPEQQVHQKGAHLKGLMMILFPVPGWTTGGFEGFKLLPLEHQTSYLQDDFPI